MDRGNKGNKHAAKTNPPTGDEGGYSRNQTEEKANGGRRGGIQVTNTGMFAHTRNGTENLDQLLTSWLEAEETAQDGSHPQQGQCLARSLTLCLERELDEQGNKGLSA